MAKKVDYPRCSFDDALNIMLIVRKVGGKATSGVIADALKLKESGGGFKDKMAGTIKYGMLVKEGLNLKLSEISNNYLYPLDDTEKEKALFEMFTSVQIYKELIQKFVNKEDIDKNTLISMLVRMYDVHKNVASKVAWYFLKAITKYNFLEQSNNLKLEVEEITEESTTEKSKQPAKPTNEKVNTTQVIKTINRDQFELLLRLGNLLYSKNDLIESENKIKTILQENKTIFSHAELFADLITNNNKQLIEKVKIALMKDFNIENEQDE